VKNSEAFGKVPGHRNAYSAFMEKPLRKWPLVRLRKRWVDNIITDLKNTL
jgi:hypothetical protein